MMPNKTPHSAGRKADHCRAHPSRSQSLRSRFSSLDPAEIAALTHDNPARLPRRMRVRETGQRARHRPISSQVPLEKHDCPALFRQRLCRAAQTRTSFEGAARVWPSQWGLGSCAFPPPEPVTPGRSALRPEESHTIRHGQGTCFESSKSSFPVNLAAGRQQTSGVEQATRALPRPPEAEMGAIGFATPHPDRPMAQTPHPCQDRRRHVGEAPGACRPSLPSRAGLGRLGDGPCRRLVVGQ